jgi:hypothetical protein
MFFDDVKTLYDLESPETHRIKVEQIYSDYHKGDTTALNILQYAALKDVVVTDLDTAKPLTTSVRSGSTVVQLAVPIQNDKQSAHLQVRGTLEDLHFTIVNELMFSRPMKGLRNTVLLPSGWEVASVSQSATIGMYQGRAFVALVNLNEENSYTVAITARRTSR